jgi:hypothetical protein
MRQWMICSVITLLAFAAGTAPLRAQFPWPYDAPKSVPTEPPASSAESALIPSAPTGNNPVAAIGPAIAGKWSGQLTQIGSRSPYNVELAITAKNAESKYPDLGCVGKLTRVGASKSYVFFIEVITKGAANKGGRCPDGTVTMARSADKLALEWFGNIEGDMFIAYGTLSQSGNIHEPANQPMRKRASAD